MLYLFVKTNLINLGRVARAGKSGISISFIAHDEMAYLLDLFLFIGRPIQFIPYDSTKHQWDKNGLF